jgi:hypothetical protein
MRTHSRYRQRVRAAIARCVLVARAASCAIVCMATGAATFVAAPAAAATVSVDAVIEPAQIALGESARLTIQTSGSGSLSVTLPVVSGLEFRVIGQSHQIQSINGATFESTSTIVRVTPEEAGVFTIPGPTPKSPPLVLRVNPSSGPGASAAPNNGATPGLPLYPNGVTSADGIRLTPDGSVFLRLEVPKREIYVGESVPAAIQIGMRDGFAISNSLPTLNGSDFTLNNLSFQPERSPKVIDGKHFTIFTWRSVMSAVKPGTFTVNFTAPVTVRIRTQPRGDSLLDDLLGDPFMQNVFGSTVQKNITVTSPDTAFTVLPLPTEGRPPDFGGAVGSFKISTEISSIKTTAGDPLTLHMHVNGAGNFDRVQSSMLGGSAEWKTYEPKATFSPSEPSGFRGQKNFEQPLIATQAGTLTIPPLTFNYFDPGTRKYETARSSPLNVTVAPAADSASNAPPLPPAAGTPADESRSGLRPDHVIAGTRVDSLIPPYFKPPFVTLVSAMSLLFAGGWVELRRRERNANDLQRERERVRAQLTLEMLEQMTAASTAADAAVFFNAARSALQQSLSARWQLAPEQITVDDIDTRLEGADRDDVRQIFVFADEANYSGDELKAADFERWTQVVRGRLDAETPS